MNFINFTEQNRFDFIDMQCAGKVSCLLLLFHIYLCGYKKLVKSKTRSRIECSKSGLKIEVAIEKLRIHARPNTLDQTLKLI